MAHITKSTHVGSEWKIPAAAWEGALAGAEAGAFTSAILAFLMTWGVAAVAAGLLPFTTAATCNMHHTHDELCEKLCIETHYE